ncbi:MAG: hypothetical protein AAB408_02290 [Patescibacteria group bacterium]
MIALNQKTTRNLLTLPTNIHEYSDERVVLDALLDVTRGWRTLQQRSSTGLSASQLCLKQPTDIFFNFRSCVDASVASVPIGPRVGRFATSKHFIARRSCITVAAMPNLQVTEMDFAVSAGVALVGPSPAVVRFAVSVSIIAAGHTITAAVQFAAKSFYDFRFLLFTL